MKTRLNLLFITTLGFLTLNSWAESPAGNEGVETKIVDGFFMSVSDYYGYTNTSPDRPLCFSVWTRNVSRWTTNKFLQPINYSMVISPVKPEYAYQVELFDTNGVAVPKTAAGKRAGTKFLDFCLKTAVVRLTFGPEPNAMRTMVIEKVGAERSPNLFTFRPSDLFEISKPGNYTLKIHLQIIAFPRTGPNRGEYTNKLIRFPPLDYPLVKK